MSALSQKTVNDPLSIKGIGLHTGEPVNIKINPAESPKIIADRVLDV